MKRALVFSFLGAAGCHALVLFGFQMTDPAVRCGGEMADMEVSLVGDSGNAREEGNAAGQGEAAASEPTPAPESAPVPAPNPEPLPEAAPEVVSETDPAPEALPSPSPTPSPAVVVQESTPVPKNAAKPAPKTRPASSRTAPRSAKTAQGHGEGVQFGGEQGGGGASGGSPRYRFNPRPEYPSAARRDRQEGVVTVKVEVQADGKPAGVALVRSSGFPLLDEAAVRGVGRWTFYPAKVAGLPVPAEVEVPVRFTLKQ